MTKFYQIYCSKCGAVSMSCYTKKDGTPHSRDLRDGARIMGKSDRFQARVCEDFDIEDMLKKCECEGREEK